VRQRHQAVTLRKHTRGKRGRWRVVNRREEEKTEEKKSNVLPGKSLIPPQLHHMTFPKEKNATPMHARPPPGPNLIQRRSDFQLLNYVKTQHGLIYVTSVYNQCELNIIAREKKKHDDTSLIAFLKQTIT